MEGVSDSGKPEVEGASRGCSFLEVSRSYWCGPNSKSRTQTVILKILGQRDLYHNPDPLGRLVGEVYESKVIIEGQEMRALLDAGSQLSSISWTWVNKLNLEPKQLQSILQIEGSGSLEVPYLGYVEVQLELPEVKAFNHLLLLIVPDSAHTQCTPLTLGTLHINMAIKMATKRELGNLNKQWQRCSVAMRLSMRELQVVDVEEAQIVSQLDRSVKLAKDVIMGPLETVETKGILWKTPNHYKRMNIVVDELPGQKSYRYIVVVAQLEILKAGSDRVPMVLQNLTSRTLRLKKGMNVAHVEASQVVPSLEEPAEEEKAHENSSGKVPMGERNERMSKILQQLDLKGIGSWMEQQQHLVRKMLEEYQHLFALSLNELSRTSLVQHEIKFSDSRPLKKDIGEFLLISMKRY